MLMHYPEHLSKLNEIRLTLILPEVLIYFLYSKEKLEK